MAESVDPLRGVELRTEARLLPAGDLAGADPHRDPVRGSGEGRRVRSEGAGYDSVIGRLEPGHLRIWDFDDE